MLIATKRAARQAGTVGLGGLPYLYKKLCIGGGRRREGIKRMNLEARTEPVLCQNLTPLQNSTPPTRERAHCLPSLLLCRRNVELHLRNDVDVLYCPIIGIMGGDREGLAGASAPPRKTKAPR